MPEGYWEKIAQKWDQNRSVMLGERKKLNSSIISSYIITLEDCSIIALLNLDQGSLASLTKTTYFELYDRILKENIRASVDELN